MLCHQVSLSIIWLHDRAQKIKRILQCRNLSCPTAGSPFYLGGPAAHKETRHKPAELLCNEWSRVARPLGNCFFFFLQRWKMQNANEWCHNIAEMLSLMFRFKPRFRWPLPLLIGLYVERSIASCAVGSHALYYLFFWLQFSCSDTFGCLSKCVAVDLKHYGMSGRTVLYQIGFPPLFLCRPTLE